MFSVILNKRWRLWGYLLWNWSSAKTPLQRSLQGQLQLIPAAGAAGHQVSMSLPDWIWKGLQSHSFFLDTNRWMRLCTPFCQTCRFGEQIVRQIVQRSGRRQEVSGVCRMGERWDVGAMCVGAVLGDAPRPSPSWERGLGLVRPNIGVVEGESWCFLLVLRAILTKLGEGKNYYRYKITELVKRHNSPVVHTTERNWEFLDQFVTATDLLCYFQAVTQSLHPPSVKQQGLEQFVSLKACI